MKSWHDAARVYFDRRVVVIFFLGFSSGLPLLLVFSTMSVWLKVEGVSLTAIGLFSLVRTPYALKFLWAPLIDRLPLPVLSKMLGRRRGWALVTQAALMAAIFAMSMTGPGVNPAATALFALLVAFCSASQDIVIDAYRVESLDEDQQGAGAGTIVLGYRVGMLSAGAGALWLASVLTWPQVYMVMAALGAVGMITVLCAGEPRPDVSLTLADNEEKRIADHLAAGLPLWSARGLAWLYEAVIAPFNDFMRRPGWVAILLFIMLYKLGEAYQGVMANPFYVEMGFSMTEIAAVSKVFGLGATLVGALIGGIAVSRYGIMPSLMICGILQIAGILMFCVQAVVGHDVLMLMATITAENVTAGMATTAFVAYLSSLCTKAYTATQYALLSSLMAFARDMLSSSSGWAAETMGWFGFFIFSAALAVPGLLVLWWLGRRRPTAQAHFVKGL
ncbi:MAG: MFS transporter permease [Rhodospirillales bacterium RIFCSPLOWO2_12_FULL_58_28]|nr:MAG: MFS transporter permease [Rhodospirillales bacterium RIFCSPLOWO2_02_FULL_58_16]OHC78486.1 MAG: MFS transporter permease [Rhodospirillales bacterium RIFCSPLOWO2_12_FULL_58_28]